MNWLTEDPVGKFLMGTIGTIIVSGLLDILKPHPVWAHFWSACLALMIGLGLRLWERKRVLLSLVGLGAAMPWFLPILALAWTVVWKWLVSPQQVRGWMLVLIAVGPLGIAFAGIALAVWLSEVRDSGQPRWKDYTKDFIFGAEWQWRWTGEHLEELTPFCPQVGCANQLELGGRYHRREGYLYCDRCGYSVTTPDDTTSWQVMRYRVEKEIRRRLNTGLYKKALEQDHVS